MSYPAASESRSVGYRTAHDSHELRQRGGSFAAPLKPIYGKGDDHAHAHSDEREHVEPDAPFLERREEAGAYLHADGEDEEYKPEFTQEMERVALHRVAKMSHQDTYEKHERNAERNAEDLYLAEVYSGKYDERIKKNRACQRKVVGRKHVNEPFHKV